MPQRKLRLRKMHNLETFDSLDLDFEPVKDLEDSISDNCIEEYTLMSALEKIVITLYQSKLNNDRIAKAQKAIDFLCKEGNMQPMQAIFFAICVNQYIDSAITIDDIRRWIGCPMISILRYQNLLDELVERNILMPGRRDNRFQKTYAVPQRLLDNLPKGLITEGYWDSQLSFAKFIDTLEDIFDMRCNRNVSLENTINSINTLINSNLHLEYCRQINDLKGLNDTELLLLHYFCIREVNHNDKCIGQNDLTDILDSQMELTHNLRQMANGKHSLCTMGFVEPVTNNFMADSSSFTLTNMVRTSLLIEANLELSTPEQTIRSKELIKSQSITEKKLFFNKETGKQISRLYNLLTDSQYSQICSRLEKAGMRKGFACLFYGAPGTGKTELALQLAKRTNRDIMQVNISDMRSKWVGESEKLVKNLFDRYRNAVQNSKTAPILLFNEADALLNKRNPNTERSVDKMENALQNIFLQEIETLEGILIATTNLTTNLDPAFERRFLYKIKFEKPDAECRRNIWQSMINGLPEDTALSLASSYDFSGGQIENISRKHIIDSILYGESKNLLTSLKTYCDNELIQNPARKKIGFSL